MHRANYETLTHNLTKMRSLPSSTSHMASALHPAVEPQALWITGCPRILGSAPCSSSIPYLCDWSELSFFKDLFYLCIYAINFSILK